MTNTDKHALHECLKLELDRLAGTPAAVSAVTSCPDEADLAAQFNQRRVELALTQRLGRRRDELEYALERLWSESFGTCEECGRDIGAARLAARPTARYCIRCQEAVERELTACA
jgi:DnaK suppressor protein